MSDTTQRLTAIEQWLQRADEELLYTPDAADPADGGALAPCPTCQTILALYQWHLGAWWYLECLQCQRRAPCALTLADARAQWQELVRHEEAARSIRGEGHTHEAG